ncbi:hypothetical protein ACP70R_021192 [Stipagrostis hirtigluma subsp. patula]
MFLHSLSASSIKSDGRHPALSALSAALPNPCPQPLLPPRAPPRPSLSRRCLTPLRHLALPSSSRRPARPRSARLALPTSFSTAAARGSRATAVGRASLETGAAQLGAGGAGRSGAGRGAAGRERFLGAAGGGGARAVAGAGAAGVGGGGGGGAAWGRWGGACAAHERAQIRRAPPAAAARAARARWEGWGQLQLARTPSAAAVEARSAGAARRKDLRLLLGVMGAPLASVHDLRRRAAAAPQHQGHRHFETSSMQYILQQYLAVSGGQRLLSLVQNAYAMGKVRMVATEFETGGRVVRNRMAARCADPGRFVLWQMAPEMWCIKLAVGGIKVHAGCNGKLVWRHTPWLGAHAAKGPVRPLHRALQV